MTAEQLLSDALASASADDDGLRLLRIEIDRAEKVLADARAALQQAEAEEARLIQLHASINERLSALGGEAITNRRDAAKAILEVL